jgi:hypothetical protein
MEIGVSEQFLAESGVLRVRVTEDCELDGGAWKPAGDQKGWLIVKITPSTVPMFQQVVDCLETKPVLLGGTSKHGPERGRHWFSVFQPPRQFPWWPFSGWTREPSHEPAITV